MMFKKFIKSAVLMIIPTALMLTLTACDEEVAAPPAAEPVDLSQTEDLFSEPIKPNPLTSDPAAVIVRVNGEDITRGEIMDGVKMAMQQLGGRIPPEQMLQAQQQMFQRFKDELITKKLIDAAVAAANITVSAEDIEEALNQLRSRIPEGKTLEEAIAAQGGTLEEMKQSIKNDMAIRKFLESKTADTPVATEDEAKEFYDSNPDRFKKPESVTASHILLGFGQEDTDEIKAEKRAQLEKIRADIIAGTVTFEDAAMAHSACPSGKQNSGSLGTFGKGQMVPSFEMAAFTQEADEVGDIVETQFGYHIIKVTGHEEEGVVSFDEAREQLLTGLSSQKKQQIIADYIKSLRDSATIEEISM